MLAQIGTVPWVAEAWLSRDGNFLVVLPRADMPPQGEVAAMVEEAGRNAVLLSDVNRDTVLGLFAQRDGWMQAQTLAQLTAEESVRVAERVVKRVEASVPLAVEARSALGEIVRRRFYEVYAPRADGSKLGGDPTPAILADAERVLPQEVLEALSASLERGYGPTEGEE